MNEPLILLCGGLGKRLRSAVPDVPKVLAPVPADGETPFLFYLVKSLKEQGLSKLVLSLQYQSDRVESYLKSDPGRELTQGIEVSVIVEPKPLGTGGAVRFVLKQLGLDGSFYVMNGDTFLPTGLMELASRPEKDSACLGILEVEDRSRYGLIETDSEGRILGFLEKSKEKAGDQGPALIYAGLAALQAEAFLEWEPERESFSIETDFFPWLVEKERVQAVTLRSPFIDIGIPEDYQRFCEEWVPGLGA